MNRLNQTLLTAAVAAVFASGALAQTRVDRSGATDANKRVGSNGHNDTSTRQAPWDIQNNIVYGNTTGGKGFRGPTGSTDAQAFRGPTGSNNIDNFVRDSSSVTTGGVTSYNANTTRAYYGDSRNVPPPVGTSMVTSTVPGYTPPTPKDWKPVDPRVQSVSGGDTTTYNPANGQFMMSGGPVDSIYAPNAPIAIRSDLAQPTGMISDYTTLNTTTTSQLTPSQINQLQGVDPQSKIPGQTPAAGQTLSPDAQALQASQGGNPVNNVGTTGGDTTNDSQPSSSSTGAVPLNNAVTPQSAPELGIVTRMVTRTDQKPAAGTPAADDNGPKRPGQAAEEANRDFNTQLRAQKAANADKATKPTAEQKPDVDNKPAAGNPPPKVGTFAGAATDKGITELMTKAEGQLKDGKYASAIDTYGAAEALSPRSATIKLGRANAELGGSYYKRAEASLRQAFIADKNLLKSQYDLRAFLGDERLQAIQKDLSDLVQANDKDTNAAVALAYVYYNTGNERRAQALLDVADKRAGSRDPLIRAMKTAWTFSGVEQTK